MPTWIAVKTWLLAATIGVLVALLLVAAIGMLAELVVRSVFP